MLRTILRYLDSLDCPYGKKQDTGQARRRTGGFSSAKLWKGLDDDITEPGRGVEVTSGTLEMDYARGNLKQQGNRPLTDH